jgi:membrane associated rhomboid family serine protease
MNGYGRGFMALPPVVKNLILINVVMLIADFTAKSVFGTDLTTILGLYFPKSDKFMPLQIITHMFMHANFMHLFFNMFALYMLAGSSKMCGVPKGS